MASAYTLDYELKHEDAVILIRRLLRRKGLERLFFPEGSLLWHLAALAVALPIGFFVPHMVLSLAGVIDGAPPEVEVRTLLYVVGIMASLVFPTLLKRALQRAVDRTAGKQALGARKLTVSSDGLIMQSAPGETSRSWREVREIEVTESHVIMVSDVMFVVPRSAFYDDDEFQQFLAWVKNWQGSGDASE